MRKEENDQDKTRTHAVLTEGTLVPPYRIIDKIGAGGMGEVYLAEDTRLHRPVAIKFLPAHLTNNADIRTRFLREAQAVAKLNHPNIVTIHDVNEFNGRPYYVMEHIEGVSLHHFAHEETLPVDQLIEYAIQICQGLAEAHRAGIIHRDIKAANIAIDKKGRARLLDFGLAAMAGDDRLTRTGSTLGTVAYMSPEQVSGREIDHRSDLFSLGVVLYELVAGRTPFRRDNEGATLKAIMEDIPEPLTRYKSDVPEKLQQIISQLLEKDKELRYQSAEGVIADLKRLMYDSQSSAYARSVPGKAKKNRLMMGLAAASVLAAVVMAAIMFLSSIGTDDGIGDKVPMIAVLPFENLGSAEDDYFADGMTEEITSRLAVIAGLGVISRTSAMKYKMSNKSLKEIGHELGVDYVVEGTVRWSKVGGQPKVRITPQLVRVSDDRHMWADNYERELLEVFAVQADIAAKIVDQLGLTLLDADLKHMASRLTENAAAYEFYLKGLNAVRRFDLDNNQAQHDMKTYLDSAVALDPMFAEAHALRSMAYSIIAFNTRSPETSQIARESAERALELHPGLPLGHQALGTYYNLIETDYDRALEEFNHALSELHNDADLLASIALVQMRQGQFLESQKNYRRAADLDPLNAARHYSLGISLSFTRSLAEAEQSYDRAIALDPQRVSFYTAKIGLYSSWYGEWNKIEPVVREALAQTDTLEFVGEFWWLSQWLTDFPWDSVFESYKSQYRDNLEIDKYLAVVAAGAYFLGDSTTMKIYSDSARIEIEKKLKQAPDDAHRTSALGLAYAYLGDCDRAVELGQKGKELLSVDECHW